MSHSLIFHPEVQGEIKDAFRWYEQQRPGLGVDFVRALEDVFLRISNTPAMHQMIWQNVRRALPKAFPYGVFYRIEGNRVEVVAVQHASRDPSHWKSRL